MDEQIAVIFQKLDVLAKVKPGYVVSVSERQWNLCDHTSLKQQIMSGITTAFRTLAWPPKRRDAFIEAAKPEITKLIQFYEIRSSHGVVLACCDGKGQLMQTKVQERMGSDNILMLSYLKFLASILWYGKPALEGLRVLKTSPPYNEDQNFHSQVTIQLIDPLQGLLTEILRRAGDFHQIVQNHESMAVMLAMSPKIKPLSDSKALVALTPTSMPATAAAMPNEANSLMIAVDSPTNGIYGANTGSVSGASSGFGAATTTASTGAATTTASKHKNQSTCTKMSPLLLSDNQEADGKKDCEDDEKREKPMSDE